MEIQITTQSSYKTPFPYHVAAHGLIFEPERYFNECHASTIERYPDGDLATAWFAGTREKNPDTAIWFSLCRKGSWSEPKKVADCPGIACWNPVLFLDGERLILFYKIGAEIPYWKTMVTESFNRGSSWSNPQELVPGDVGGRGPVKNKCIRLKDGSFLAPASVETLSEWRCFTDRSVDGGLTWLRGDFVPMDPQEISGKGIIQPTLWEDETGAVHMLTRSTEGRIFSSVSYNKGASWNPCRKTLLPNNNSGIDLTRLTDGRLVLVYNPVSGDWAARTPISIAVSCNNGQNWEKLIDLEHDGQDNQGHAQEYSYSAIITRKLPSEFSYPAIISREKTVFLTYTWQRKSIAFWQIEFC